MLKIKNISFSCDVLIERQVLPIFSTYLRSVIRANTASPIISAWAELLIPLLSR